MLINTLCVCMNIIICTDEIDQLGIWVVFLQYHNYGHARFSLNISDGQAL